MKPALRLSKEAESDLEFLHKADRKLFTRVLTKIEVLSESPMEGKPLVGNHKGEYSLRIGAYRVVYQVDPAGKTIFILTVKHRKNVY